MFKQLECFVVVCDICQVEAEEGYDYLPHYPTELKAEAADNAQENDWTVWEGHHWCPECRPVCSREFCAHSFEEHDYGKACEGDGFNGEVCGCKAFVVDVTVDAKAG